MRFITCLAFVTLLAWGGALASPSVFPEDAAFIKVGYNGQLIGSLGAELRVPVAFVDMSAGLEAFADTGGLYGVKLDTSILVFPALGTRPPLALGLGGDVSVSNRSTKFHIGVVAGTDLLFLSDLPATVSAYLAPGYASSGGFSLGWAFQLRYYLDTVAFELATTDLTPIGVSVRFLF